MASPDTPAALRCAALQAIETDVRLVTANCRYFNAPHTAFARSAVALEERFDASWPPTVTDAGAWVRHAHNGTYGARQSARRSIPPDLAVSTFFR